MKLDPMYINSKKRKDGPRNPLRTIEELAAHFSATVMELAVFLANNNGPKKHLRVGKSGRNNTWYDPAEVIPFVKAFEQSKTLFCNGCQKEKLKTDFYQLSRWKFQRPCKDCTRSKRLEKALEREHGQEKA